MTLIYQENFSLKKHFAFYNINSKVDELSKKINDDPKDIISYLQLSDLATHTSQHDLANDFLKTAEKLDNSSVIIKLKIILNLINSNDIKNCHKKILNFFTDYKSYNLNEDPDIFIKLANILYITFGDVENNYNFIIRSTTALPDNPSGFRSLAEFFFYRLGDIRTSRNLFLRTFYKFEDLYSILGLIKIYETRDPKKALKVLGKFESFIQDHGYSIEQIKFKIISSFETLEVQNQYLDKIQNHVDFYHYAYHKNRIDDSFLGKHSLESFKKKTNSMYISFYNELDHNKKKSKQYKLSFLEYLVSKKYESFKSFDNEVEYLKKSKLSNFESIYLVPLKSNLVSKLTTYSDKQKNYFKKIIFNNALYSQKSLSPIFIVGLMRSGSTVLEKIIGQSPDIYNCEESTIIRQFLNRIHLNLKKENIVEVYNQNFPQLKNFKRFTDKSLDNFLFIDLILELYPDAKFINTFRDPKENVFAIFKSFFENVPYSYDLENILEYMDMYYKIMKSMIAKYPNSICTFHYQSFIKNPNIQAEDLFNFLEIKWKKNYLNFHKKENFSRTYSNIQIKGEISKKYINKYVKYYYLLEKYKDRYVWLR